MPLPRGCLPLAITLVATTGVAAAQAPGPPATGLRRTCGTEQVARSFAPPPLYAPGQQRVIYLNRRGATFQIMGNTTNSSTNVVHTNVSANRGPRTAEIGPIEPLFNWDGVVACLTQHFRPYDVRLVEIEPTSGDYIEAIVGGDGTELGYGSDQLFGIAAADNFCGLTERGVAFTFSGTHIGVPQRDGELCATIAHEVGHLLALEHETLSTDLMSYVLVNDSPSKAFVNQASACGVAPGNETGCSCGGSTTNSGGRLTTFVGLRATETNPPTLSVIEPGNDGRVAPYFRVIADASDAEGMADVLIYLDGVAVAVGDAPDGNRYSIVVDGASVGGHTLAVVARDLAGNTTRTELPITVALLDDGADCESGGQCTGGICAQGGDGNFCTQVCDPSGDTCGSDFECKPAGGLDLCVPVAGGCCSAAGGSRHLAGSMLLVLAVLVGLRRRNRR